MSNRNPARKFVHTDEEDGRNYLDIEAADLMEGLGLYEGCASGHVDYVIDGLLRRGQIAWLFGPPASLKTYTAIDLALSIATLRPWAGRSTGEHWRDSVIYLAGEGAPSIADRAEAWLQYHEETSLPNWFLLAPSAGLPQFDAHNGEAVEYFERFISSKQRAMNTLFKAMQEAEAVEKSSGVPVAGLDEVRQQYRRSFSTPSLIIIDTYSTISGGDTKESVTRVMRTIREIQALFSDLPSMQPAVLVIDHTDKSEQTYIGSVGKLGGVDLMLEARRISADVVEIRNPKRRDGPEADPFAFKAVKVETRSGSQLVLEDGTKAAALHSVSKSKHGAALLDVLRQHGGEMDLEALRTAYAEQYPDDKPDTVRRRFMRSIERLNENGVIDLADSDDGKIVSEVPT